MVGGECAGYGSGAGALPRAAPRDYYAGYVDAIKARDRHRAMNPKPLRAMLVASCVDSLTRITESIDHTAGEARAALVQAFEILAAFLAFLLGVPLPAATAPGTTAAVPPVPALGIPASHVAQLFAAGPIRA
jgi:hypothetical protein